MLSLTVSATKVSSIIKGSLESLQESLTEHGRSALSREAYLSLGKEHERLEPERRELLYRAFEIYHANRRPGMWDRADRVLRLVRHVVGLALQRYPGAEPGHALREYLAVDRESFRERVYADEVQDCTPMELMSLMIAGGGDVSRHVTVSAVLPCASSDLRRLFVAGDTAQQVGSVES